MRESPRSRSSNNKEVAFEIEAIKTPAGLVPTVKSVEKIVNSLNVLSEDIANTRDTLLERILNVEKDVISIRKLLAEQIVALEATKETLNELTSKITTVLRQFTDKWCEIEDTITSMDVTIRELQERLEELSIKMEEEKELIEY
ncbi:MAG: hypothetical protein ACTSYM_12150 [Candidatus Baldrarchaeia archaeon]